MKTMNRIGGMWYLFLFGAATVPPEKSVLADSGAGGLRLFGSWPARKSKHTAQEAVKCVFPFFVNGVSLFREC
eukprot:4659371-Amphidinium_carterae.1